MSTGSDEPQVTFVILDNNICSGPLLELTLETARLAREMNYDRQIFLVLSPLLHAELARRAITPSLTDPYALRNKIPSLIGDPRYQGLILVADVKDTIGDTDEPSTDKKFLGDVRAALLKHWDDLESKGVVKEVTEFLREVEKNGKVELAYQHHFPDLNKPLKDQLSDYVVGAFYTRSDIHALMKQELGGKFKFDKADDSIADFASFCAMVAENMRGEDVPFDLIIPTRDAGLRTKLVAVSENTPDTLMVRSGPIAQLTSAMDGILDDLVVHAGESGYENKQHLDELQRVQHLIHDEGGQIAKMVAQETDQHGGVQGAPPKKKDR